MKVRWKGVRRMCRIVVAYVVASTGSGDGPSHSTPSLAAASTPDRAPSSWKPQPCQAPAKHDPVGVALGQPALGRDRGRGVDRVLVLHRVDDLRLVDEVLAAEGDDEAPAVRTGPAAACRRVMS